MFKYSFLIVLIAFLLINFNGQENQIVGGKIKKERSEFFWGNTTALQAATPGALNSKKA
ncbi:hypothetical protein [Priestia megaterium]|uniref:hypothetical protein n=1 Tax=Priestia megaterium TaxID=1404 RepID=UPI001EDD462A|nr:hypothetical protein [Priestia megaterium]MDH3170647.1 hypothetical protein [Priestia megaterium]